MKTLKFTILLLCMLIINCCTKKDEDEILLGGPDPYYQHDLWLSFQDALGNDLLEGIGYDFSVSGSKKIGEVTCDAGETIIWKYGTGEYAIVKTEDLGGMVKPELYTLEYVFEDGIPNPWQPKSTSYAILDQHYPELYLQKSRTLFHEEWMSGLFYGNPDYNYLRFFTQSHKYTGFAEALLYGWDIEYCDFAEKIIFRLTCPYLFGDNEAHDIVTWWEPHGYYTTCFRVEYGGKEFPVEEESCAVILDR